MILRLAFPLLFAIAVVLSAPFSASAAELKEGLAAVKEADWDKARAIFEELASQEHAGALYSLGLMYQRGRGVEQDPMKAIAYYKRAAEAGSANAMNNLGMMYKRGIGIPVDYEAARKWFAKAVDVHTMAKLNLADLYERGHGGPRDYVAAAKLYEKCAAEGAVPCMYRFARALDTGRGVEKDPERAKALYYQAAEKNYPLAVRKVRMIEAEQER